MNEINPQNQQNQYQQGQFHHSNKINIISNRNITNKRLQKRKNQFIKNGGFGL